MVSPELRIKIIEGIGGKYYPEREWKDRSDKDWMFVFVDWMP